MKITNLCAHFSLYLCLSHSVRCVCVYVFLSVPLFICRIEATYFDSFSCNAVLTHYCLCSTLNRFVSSVVSFFYFRISHKGQRFLFAVYFILFKRAKSHTEINNEMGTESETNKNKTKTKNVSFNRIVSYRIVDSPCTLYTNHACHRQRIYGHNKFLYRDTISWRINWFEYWMIWNIDSKKSNWKKNRHNRNKMWENIAIPTRYVMNVCVWFILEISHIIQFVI